MAGVSAVFAKVTHIDEDYATVQLVAEIIDTEHPENTRPKIEFEAPLEVGAWLEKLGACTTEEGAPA